MNSIRLAFAARDQNCNFFTSRSNSVWECKSAGGKRFQGATEAEAKAKANADDNSKQLSPLPAIAPRTSPHPPPAAPPITIDSIANTINDTIVKPIQNFISPQSNSTPTPTSTSTKKLNATGSATQQAGNRFFDAQAGVGVGLGLPGVGSASLNNIQSAIDNTLSQAGIPPAILGVSTPLLIATGVAGVILLLLVVKR